MNWKTAPECFLPEMLRGKPINRLIRDKVEFCFENFIDEGKDAASTSYNILDESRINILAFMGLAIFVLILLIFIVTMTLCMRQHNSYNGREDVKKGRLKKSKSHLIKKRAKKRIFTVSNSEKCIVQSLIVNSDISYKIPLQDRVNVFLKDSPS